MEEISLARKKQVCTERETNRESAEQRIVGHEANTPIICLTGDNGDTYTSTAIGLGKEEDHDWEVVSRPLVPDEIPCVETLRKLFEASIETNNPVYRC